jgi:hypothetical protein
MGRDAIQHANRVFRERHAQARRGHAYREGEEVLLSSEHLSLRGEHPKFFPKFVGSFKIAALRGVNTVELSIPFYLGPSEEDVQPEALAVDPRGGAWWEVRTQTSEVWRRCRSRHENARSSEVTDACLGGALVRRPRK